MYILLYFIYFIYIFMEFVKLFNLSWMEIIDNCLAFNILINYFFMIIVNIGYIHTRMYVKYINNLNI